MAKSDFIEVTGLRNGKKHTIRKSIIDAISACESWNVWDLVYNLWGEDKKEPRHYTKMSVYGIAFSVVESFETITKQLYK